MTTTALITGANKGIGLETARQLAARGMTVLLGARDVSRGTDAERELQAEGHGARLIHLDVTDGKLIAAAAAFVDAEYGHLDVLVNNAGIATMGGAPSATSLEGFRTILETNVLGVIAVTNAMLPLLRRAPGARIVNVSSEVGSVTLVCDHANPHVGTARVAVVSGLESGGEHGHRDVRQGARGHRHPGQRRQPGLLRHRPERP